VPGIRRVQQIAMDTQQRAGGLGGMRGRLQRGRRRHGGEVQSRDPMGEPVRLEMRLGAMLLALFPIVGGVGRGTRPGGAGPFLECGEIGSAGQGVA